MGMRKNDAILIGILIASNLVTPLLGQVLKGADPIVKILVQVMISVGLLSILIVKTKMLQWEASTYDIFRANINGETILDIPVRKGWKRATVQNPNAHWLNVTPLEFAYEMKIPGFGEKIKRAHVTHFDPITNRLDSIFQENVLYKGDEIEHNNVYLVELWTNDQYPVSQEESSIEPNFILRSAGKADRSDKKIKTRILANSLALDQRYDVLLSRQPKNVKEYITRLKLQKDRLLEKHVEDQTYISQLVEGLEHWRIDSISKEGKLESANQEITGMVEDDLNVKKTAERRIESKITNLNDIYQLGKDNSWYKNLDIKWVAIAFISIFFVVYLWANPNIIQGITNISTSTLIVFLALAGVVGFIVYYIYQIYRGKQ